MASISNGESGSSVRTKLNAALAAVTNSYLSQTNISASQFLNCGLTPIVIAPAPGANKCIVRVSFSFDYKYGGTPFESGGVMSLRCIYDGTLTSESLFAITVLDKTESHIASGFAAQESVNSQARTAIANKAVVLRAEDAVNPTAGNSTAVMYLSYDIIDLSL